MSGLFGNKSGGSIFGGSKPTGSTGGGIFGGSNPTQGQPSSTGGGLFGGGGGARTGGGLFGSGNTGARTGGGLFGGGGSTSNTKPGGLFGSSSGTSGGSIFGGSTTKPSTFGGSSFGGGSSGGIFGSSSNNSMSGGSTFGTNSGTSGGGLFGGSKSTTSTGGGLFGSKSSTGGGIFGGGGGNTSTGSGMFGSSNMGGNTNAQSASLDNGTVNISNFMGIKDKDNSNDSKTLINLNSITADASLVNYSLEELRLADYILKKQGKANFPIGAQPGQNKGFMGAKTGGFMGSSAGSTFGKSSGGGLFGSTTAPTTSSGGGLFGSSSTQNKTGGLFGSSTASTSSTGGGLFGANKPATGSGGLFGSSTANKGIGSLQRSNATSSLFGANKTSTTTGGGLFGSSTGGSAFGSKPASGGLFGSSTASTGGGLFGSSAPKSAFGGSTFGASSGGSLFGSKPATGGGLFGSSAQQPTATTIIQPQPDMSYIQAYSSLTQDPYGLKDLESAFKLHTIDADKQVILNKIVDQVLQYSGQKSPQKHDPNTFSDDIASFATYADMPIKIKLQRRGNHDRYYDSGKNMINSRRFEYHDKSNFDRYQEQERQSRMIDYTRAKSDIDLSSGHQYAEERRKLRETANFLEKNKPTSSQDSYPETNQSSQKSVAFKAHRENDEQYLTGPNIIRVKVSVFVQDGEELLILSIDKTRKIGNLKELVISKLKHKYPDIESAIIRIVHKSRILNEENTLVESGVENGMRFDVLVQEQESETTTRTFTQNSLTSKLEDSNTKNESKSESNLAPFEILPKCNRVNYKLTPSLVEMARMTEKELSQISNLSIENNNGKIMWEGITDVRNINFDELVNIELFAAEVYPENIEQKGLKPAVGQEINKPAIIELYNLRPPKKMSEARKQRFIDGLRDKASSMEDTYYIGYDEESATLKFKVEHFTKYSFTGADSDDDQSEPAEESSQHEEQNAQIKSIQKAQEDQPRFSFGANQPSSVLQKGKRSSFEVEQEDDDSMDVDGQRQSLNKVDYLEKINEESESRVSSMLEDDEYDHKHNKKSHKIQFYERQEKEFEDDNYEESEEAEEEYDDQQSQIEPKTIDEIRAEIDETEKSMKELFGKIYQQSANKNNGSNLNRISKFSGPNNKILGHFKTYAGFGVPQNTTDVKQIMVPYSWDTLDGRKDYSPMIVQQSENEIIELYIASLQGHLKASTISLNQNQEGVSQLPSISLPNDETSLTRMWFSILSSLKHSDISQDSDIKKIIDKECQVLALLNAWFGNSFIDLSHYMNNPQVITSKLIDKYAHENDKDEPRRRNQNISNWIKYTTRDEINDVISDGTLNLYEKVILYLYCGNKKAASELLNENNKHNLALLISQSNPTNDENHPILDNAIEKYANDDFKGITSMLSGAFVYNQHLSWKCNLGRLLWYSTRRIQDAMAKLSEPDDGDDNGFVTPDKAFLQTDFLSYSILKLFTSIEDVDLRLLMSERIVDMQNQLVRRSIWSAITAIKTVKSGCMKENFEECYNKLSYDYAFELESVGLWEWAIYVALHLEHSYHRTQYIKQILLKNICTDETQTKSDFLISECNIPAHYIHEARAIYFSSQNMHGHALFEWIKACENPKNWNSAFKTLIKHLSISSESKDLKFDELEIILQKLMESKTYIEDWNSQGEFLVKFLKLRKSVMMYFKEFFDEFGDFIKTDNQNIISKASIQVKDRIRDLTELIELTKRFKIDQLSLSAKVLKSEIERILLDWDVRLKIINHKLNHEAGHVSLVNEILIESENLTTNDKNDALDRLSNVILCQDQ